MEDKIVKFFNNINCTVGAVITALTAVFGWQWVLFASYLLLNFIDWITGWIKAKYKNEESSKKGLKGILKKSCYWILIAVSFLFSYLITRVGTIINVNLEFVMLFGWFTLACMLINESRSIIENLVELDIEVPGFLKKGLRVTQDLIDKAIDKVIPENKEKEENKNE